MSRTSHRLIARTKIGVTYETLVSRILRTFDRATPSDIEAGARWYDEAHEHALVLAENAGSVQHAAGIIAHLSPRTPWTRNVLAAYALIEQGERLPGIIGRNFENARNVLQNYEAGAVESTFGGPKTLRFFRNICGDREAVTVDVWAARVAGVDEDVLARVGVYNVLEQAYRAAARRRGVDPATMQATTWVVARGGRAD